MKQTAQQAPGPALYLRSFAFWLGFMLLIVVFTALLLLSFPLPLDRRFAITRAWSTSTLWWLKLTCRLEHHVEGTENIPQQAGIVFCKHQSTWETLTLNQWFDKQSWVVKRELLWVPVFGWGMFMMDPIALNRGAGRKAIDQLVEQGRERLEKGRWIIVFPEGTRTAPGKKGRYKIGGAILAERTGRPVVPVAHNAGEYWPRREFVKRPGIIEVRIGPPIDTQGRKAQEILAEAEEWIEKRMAEITILEHHQYGVNQKKA